MSIPPTFGFTIPQRGATFGLGTLPELLRLGAAAAESQHIDTLWVGDSFTSRARADSITCLAALAGMTERVRLAVGCMATFPVRDPALFAYQWASLDQASGGRALLAVCNGLQPGGASAAEGRHLGGVPDKERAPRLEENISLVRQLWTGDTISFDGRFHSYTDITIETTPVQDPCPIWITANPGTVGANREKIFRRVATLADGYQTVSMEPGALRTALADLRVQLAAAGRDLENFPIGVYHNITIGSSREDCLDEARRFALDYYGPGFMSGPALASMTAAGTPDDCITDLRELIDGGATHIALRLTSYDQSGQLVRLVDEVLPAVAAP